MFPIKNLEGVTVGIVSFENNIKESTDADGRQPPQDEMKLDLNAVFPAELSDSLSICATGVQQSYEAFRDFAVQACAQLLMRKKRLPVNHVNEENPRQEGYDSDNGTCPETIDEANSIE